VTIKTPHPSHEQTRARIIHQINEHYLALDLAALGAYLETIRLGGLLAASVAESVNDQNYTNAHAASVALHTCQYGSYAADIDAALSAIRDREVHKRG
jgi:hypothetical protein